VTPGAYPEEEPVVEEDRMSRSEVMSMFTAMDDRINTIEVNQSNMSTAQTTMTDALVQLHGPRPVAYG